MSLDSSHHFAMEWIEQVSCTEDWTFTLRPHLPVGLPSLAINRAVIWMNSGCPQVLSYTASSGASGARLLKEIFPDVSFVEQLRFLTRIQKSSSVIVNELTRELMPQFEESIGTIEKILSLPREVQIYFAEKKFHFRDLRFFSLFNGQELDLQWRGFFDYAITHSFSKSEFTQACDFLCLYFQKHADAKALFYHARAVTFLEDLKRSVLPNTHGIDDVMTERLQTQPWFQKNLMRWTRLGDRTGIELKAWIPSAVEARRLEKSLHSMLENLSTGQFFNGAHE